MGGGKENTLLIECLGIWGNTNDLFCFFPAGINSLLHFLLILVDVSIIVFVVIGTSTSFACFPS